MVNGEVGPDAALRKLLSGANCCDERHIWIAAIAQAHILRKLTGLF